MSIFSRDSGADERKQAHREALAGKRLDTRVRALERQGKGASTGRLAGQVARGMGRGFGDIAKSLATPTTRRRPRIAQLPLQDADISQPIDLEKLKHPSLRGKSIRG